MATMERGNLTGIQVIRAPGTMATSAMIAMALGKASHGTWEGPEAARVKVS